MRNMPESQTGKPVEMYGKKLAIFLQHKVQMYCILILQASQRFPLNQNNKIVAS